jgi:hypothetical protein
MLGFTVTISKVRYGESFKVTVMRKKAANNRSTLVAAGPTAERLYYQDYSIKPAEKPGWEMLSMEFSIEKRMHDRQLKIYVFNPGDEAAIFDDMEILWYDQFEYQAPGNLLPSQ